MITHKLGEASDVHVRGLELKIGNWSSSRSKIQVVIQSLKAVIHVTFVIPVIHFLSMNKVLGSSFTRGTTQFSLSVFVFKYLQEQRQCPSAFSCLHSSLCCSCSTSARFKWAHLQWPTWRCAVRGSYSQWVCEACVRCRLLLPVGVTSAHKTASVNSQHHLRSWIEKKKRQMKSEIVVESWGQNISSRHELLMSFYSASNQLSWQQNARCWNSSSASSMDGWILARLCLRHCLGTFFWCALPGAPPPTTRLQQSTHYETAKLGPRERKIGENAFFWPLFHF